MAGLTPFTLTARLQQGVVFDTGFGVTLDGLLASLLRETAKADHALARAGQPVPGSLLDGGTSTAHPRVWDLPLGRCSGDGSDPGWHWLATAGLPVDHAGEPVVADPDVHHHHARVQERIIGHGATRVPAAFPPASGRYRMRRFPVISLPAAAVVWRGVGDPDRVLALVTPLLAIGKRRVTGEGAVLGWTVRAEPDGDPDRFGHCDADGRLGRPVPLACAHRVAASGWQTAVAGIRPPYWHPATQSAAAVPLPRPRPTQPDDETNDERGEGGGAGLNVAEDGEG